MLLVRGVDLRNYSLSCLDLNPPLTPPWNEARDVSVAGEEGLLWFFFLLLPSPRFPQSPVLRVSQSPSFSASQLYRCPNTQLTPKQSKFPARVSLAVVLQDNKLNRPAAAAVSNFHARPYTNTRISSAYDRSLPTTPNRAVSLPRRFASRFRGLWREICRFPLFRGLGENSLTLTTRHRTMPRVTFLCYIHAPPLYQFKKVMLCVYLLSIPPKYAQIYTNTAKWIRAGFELNRDFNGRLSEFRGGVNTRLLFLPPVSRLEPINRWRPTKVPLARFSRKDNSWS
ncbi:hypothetical protein RRG08_052418 [Elysia crispata]|uniref:Uncharacterized protein n=1 Tax=Elysia crispata TaxID=231223 RepID=A0AAE1E9F8_9GAST|nr:hypothetical protein RRG08_052418 [Elysia crispata]